MEAQKPRYTVTIEGKKMPLQFDLNTNPTKMGVKLQFILDDAEMDPKEKQALTQKISTVLQKRFGAAGLMVDYDDRVPYQNVIGFLVPLATISDVMIKVIKGQQ